MCQRLGTSRSHELNVSKFPSVSRIEFTRSILSKFSAHVSGSVACRQCSVPTQPSEADRPNGHQSAHKHTRPRPPQELIDLSDDVSRPVGPPPPRGRGGETPQGTGERCVIIGTTGHWRSMLTAESRSVDRPWTVILLLPGKGVCVCVYVLGFSGRSSY